MFKAASGFYGVLEEALSADSTVMVLDSSSTVKLASLLGTTNHTYLYIGTRYQGEVVKATSIANGTVAIERAHDNSTAKPFTRGAGVRYVFCAAAVQDLLAGYTGGIKSVTADAPLQVAVANGVARVSVAPVRFTSPNGSIAFMGTFPNMSMAVNPRSLGLCSLGIAASEGVGSALTVQELLTEEPPDDGGGDDGGGDDGGGDGGTPNDELIPDAGNLLAKDGVMTVGGTMGVFRYLKIRVPTGQAVLTIETGGGNGVIDLYVARSALPTRDLFDGSSTTPNTNTEKVTILNPVAGTYYIGIYGYSDFDSIIVTGTYSTEPVVVEPPPPVIALARAVPVTVAGDTTVWKRFTFTVPDGASALTITTNGGTGDVDMYVRFGSAPTVEEWDYRPFESGNNENVNMASPLAGVYHIGLIGYSDYADVQLTADYTAV